MSKIFTKSRILKIFLKKSKNEVRTIQKDLPLGKFLDDSIVLAILERKFLLSLRIIKFSQ